jgi:hypothetical protein
LAKDEMRLAYTNNHGELRNLFLGRLVRPKYLVTPKAGWHRRCAVASATSGDAFAAAFHTSWAYEVTKNQDEQNAFTVALEKLREANPNAAKSWPKDD